MGSVYNHFRIKIVMNGVDVCMERKFDNMSSGTLVLQITSNLIILRHCQDENGKGMYQNVHRTCSAYRTIAFAN